MTTDTDLRDRLRDLADEAPHGSFSGAGLWRAGVRRQRRRRAAGTIAAVAAVVAVVGLASVVGTPQAERPGPAEVPFEDLAIPRTIHPPDPWSEGTAELGPPGRLAAVSNARRHTAEGLRGTRTTFHLFGVSAVDGAARFIDFPVAGDTHVGVDNFGVALSPDGTKVAVTRYRGAGADIPAIAGWDVYDTVTGETVELRVPGMRRIRGTDVFEIEFTGDSRHLLTNFSLEGSDGSRDDSLVVWDVESGDRAVAEGDGHFWLPNPGWGPAGVVWARGSRVLTFDPGTGATEQLSVAREVYEPWWSPDGTAVAYLGSRPTGRDEAAPARLYVVGSDGSAERRIDLAKEPGDILGWRGPDQLVVSHYGPRQARVVDLTTGRTEPLRLDRVGSNAMHTEYASDLWANDLVEGEAQPAAHDPRVWLRWWFWTAVAAAVLVAGLLLWRRRGRA